MRKQFGDAAITARADHHRQPVCHRFEHHHAEGVFERRVRQNVGGEIGLAHIFQLPEKMHLGIQPQALDL